jgi:thiol-disulfide isomerase/thioredoxin
MGKFTTYIIISFILIFNMPVSSQDIEYIKIPELEKILANTDDRVNVVNFWATWCGPCVKEFPMFEKVSKDYPGAKVRFLMISLDFPTQVEKSLIPFLKKNNSSLPVALMTDLDYNAWIDKVDKTWQGDIPVTLVFNNVKNQRSFHKGEIDEQGLKKLIEAFL